MRSGAIRCSHLPRGPAAATSAASAQGWIESPERIVTVGAAAWPQHAAFAYDNESPPHRVLLPAHALAERPVSNAEYRAFIDAGGYREPRWWLSEGWALREAEAGSTRCTGMMPCSASTPWAVGANWIRMRRSATSATTRPMPAPAGPVRACPASSSGKPPPRRSRCAVISPMTIGCTRRQQGSGLRQLFGDVWEWTHSAYGAYPGFRPFAGNLGEYNGKFMCGQWVLRGGSCATPRGHVRASYRNFFMPPARWQFSGLRLARDLA
jgi:formylglycine-generating enzyme required for sulfatase activity